VWSVVTYGCESWTLRKNEETRLDAFEIKGLRKIQQVSWTAKKIMCVMFISFLLIIPSHPTVSARALFLGRCIGTFVRSDIAVS